VAFEFGRNELSLSLKSDNERCKARHDKSKTTAATNVNPPPFMRYDATMCRLGRGTTEQNRYNHRANTWAFNRASYADHTEDDVPRRISSKRVIATY